LCISLWRLCIGKHAAIGCLSSSYIFSLFQRFLANKYEIATLEVDHVEMSEQCSAAIENGLENKKTPDA
jgi:hypothetical protein